MDTLYFRNAKDKENIREFDAIALAEEYFFVCEIKSAPRSNYVKEFVDLINSGQVYDYFPEYKDKKLVPVFSSFELPVNIIKNLTKNKILAMAMGEEHIEIVNKEVLHHWGV